MPWKCGCKVQVLISEYLCANLEAKPYSDFNALLKTENHKFTTSNFFHQRQTTIRAIDNPTDNQGEWWSVFIWSIFQLLSQFCERILEENCYSYDLSVTNFLNRSQSFSNFSRVRCWLLTLQMGALKYLEEIQKKKQSDVLRFLLRVRCWEVR